MPNIITAGREHISVIRSIAEKTWPVSYGSMISKEQIEYMLEWMYSDQSLLQQMDNGITFLISYDNQIPCGFAGYGAKTPGNEIFRFEKLYIVPDMQGKGIGKLLMQAVMRNAKALGGNILELNVNRNNLSVGFHKRMGFTIHKSIDLDIGGGFFMNDYIMTCPL